MQASDLFCTTYVRLLIQGLLACICCGAVGLPIPAGDDRCCSCNILHVMCIHSGVFLLDGQMDEQCHMGLRSATLEFLQEDFGTDTPKNEKISETEVLDNSTEYATVVPV